MNGRTSYKKMTRNHTLALCRPRAAACSTAIENPQQLPTFGYVPISWPARGSTLHGNRRVSNDGYHESVTYQRQELGVACEREPKSKRVSSNSIVDNATVDRFIALFPEGQSVPGACDAVNVLSFWKIQPRFFRFGLETVLHRPGEVGPATCGALRTDHIIFAIRLDNTSLDFPNIEISNPHQLISITSRLKAATSLPISTTQLTIQFD